MYDKLITVTTMLFILSMISERVVTFYKLWCVEGKRFLFGIVPRGVDTSKPAATPAEEKRRERSILAMNLSIAFIIAFTSKASLFNMFSYKKGESLDFILGWNYKLLISSWNAKGYDKLWELMPHVFSILVGCALTACFISLGSKFWHDLLDLLFEVKNLRSKQVDKATYEMDNVKELDEWISMSESDTVKKIFEENKAILKNIPGVISVGIGHEGETNYIDVMTTNEDTHLIPKFFTYYLPNKSVRKVEVRAKVTSEATTFEGSLKTGEDLASSSDIDFYGTLGLVVRKKNTATPLFLTCYHVVVGKTRNYDQKDFKNSLAIHPHGTEGKKIGLVIEGVRNNEIDIALISPAEEVSAINEYNDAKISATREIKYEERYSNINVRINGFNKRGNAANGKIRSLYNEATIHYKDANGKKYPWEFTNLIAIADDEGKSVTFGGDSGAAVLDGQNNVIGIVVGGSKELTYAIPITTIFNQLNLKLS